jgi:hypothetical protein
MYGQSSHRPQIQELEPMENQKILPLDYTEMELNFVEYIPVKKTMLEKHVVQPVRTPVTFPSSSVMMITMVHTLPNID